MAMVSFYFKGPAFPGLLPRAVKRLNLGLLVNAKQNSMVGWIQIQADDVSDSLLVEFCIALYCVEKQRLQLREMLHRLFVTHVEQFRYSFDSIQWPWALWHFEIDPPIPIGSYEVLRREVGSL